MKTLKFILVIFAMLMFNVVVGSFIAASIGFSPTVTIAACMALSLVGSYYSHVNKNRSGIMAMAIVATSAYAGEVLEQLLVRATTGNEIVAGGHIHVQPNVEKKFTIPRLKAGKMLQRRKEQPVETDSKGDFTIDEKYLEPKDVMAFTTFNPRAFESIWKPFQPSGNLVFEQLPAAVQTQLLTELAKIVDFELGGLYINSEYHATDEGKYFDGILTRIVADNDVIRIPVPAPLVQSNVLSKLKLVRASLPKPIRNNPNLKFFMSIEDGQSYEYELTDKPSKGQDYTNMNPERFKGIQIVSLADWPKDVIVAAVTSSGIDSNFWAGVSLATDAQAIQIDKLTNSGEKYFFKMLMKIDTNIVFGEHIVLYDGRDAAVAAGSTELNDLVLGAGEIVPEFEAGTLNYTLSVANNVSTTTVTATGSEAGQVLKLGSTTLATGVASAAKNLAIGENIINVSVKSADGNATSTYQVLVTRAVGA